MKRLDPAPRLPLPMTRKYEVKALTYLVLLRQKYTSKKPTIVSLRK